MRVLAIDYGLKRIGLAVSDPLGITAQGLKTLAHPSTQEDLLKKLEEIVKDRGVTKVVLGLPLNMDGTMGEQAKRVEALAQELRECLPVPVETWDERLSTASVERHFREWKLSVAKRKKIVDQLSAQLILQDYLDAQKGKAQ